MNNYIQCEDKVRVPFFTLILVNVPHDVNVTAVGAVGIKKISAENMTKFVIAMLAEA